MDRRISPVLVVAGAVVALSVFVLFSMLFYGPSDYLENADEMAAGDGLRFWTASVFFGSFGVAAYVGWIVVLAWAVIVFFRETVGDLALRAVSVTAAVVAGTALFDILGPGELGGTLGFAIGDGLRATIGGTLGFIVMLGIFGVCLAFATDFGFRAYLKEARSALAVADEEEEEETLPAGTDLVARIEETVKEVSAEEESADIEDEEVEEPEVEEPTTVEDSTIVITLRPPIEEEHLDEDLRTEDAEAPEARITLGPDGVPMAVGPAIEEAATAELHPAGAPEAEVESEPEVQPDADTESEFEAPEIEVEEPEAEVAAEPEVEVEEPEAEVVSEPEVEVEEPEAEVAAEPEIEVEEPEAEVVSEPEVEVEEPEAEIVSEPEVEAEEPEAEIVSEPEVEAEEPEAEVVSEPEVEVEDPEAEVVSESEVEEPHPAEIPEAEEEPETEPDDEITGEMLADALAAARAEAEAAAPAEQVVIEEDETIRLPEPLNDLEEETPAEVEIPEPVDEFVVAQSAVEIVDDDIYPTTAEEEPEPRPEPVAPEPRDPKRALDTVFDALVGPSPTAEEEAPEEGPILIDDEIYVTEERYEPMEETAAVVEAPPVVETPPVAAPAPEPEVMEAPAEVPAPVVMEPEPESEPEPIPEQRVILVDDEISVAAEPAEEEEPSMLPFMNEGDTSGSDPDVSSVAAEPEPEAPADVIAETGDRGTDKIPVLTDVSEEKPGVIRGLFGRKKETAKAASDPLLADAAMLALERGRASVVLLQRRLDIGYTRASRLVEALEQEGLVGPLLESGSREVLMSREEWEGR